MTTLQDAAMRKALEYIEGATAGLLAKMEAIESLRTALAQQGEQQGDAKSPKPVAYLTETEQGDMVWTPEMYGEACTYCDDGEFPTPLYTAAPAPQPVAPHAWAIQGSYIMFRGEHAEMDAKAEAKRCGGTCYAYPLYCLPPVEPNIQNYLEKDNAEITGLSG